MQGEISGFIARAGVALAACLCAGGAFAQVAAPCPRLPDGSGLSWQAMSHPDMVFCRALRGDGSEAFTVMIAPSSPFEPARGDRAEKARIDGRDVRWYRGELAGDAGMQVRETLVELGPHRVADISLRAQSDAQLRQAMTQAQGLRFDDATSRVSER